MHSFDWNTEVNTQIKNFASAKNHQDLIDFRKQGASWNLAIPTPEHYLPLLYCLALQEKEDQLTFFNDKPIAGSLSMTSLKIA